MIYGRLEEGAVPGYKDRKSGPVTLYRISPGGGVSRSLNSVERSRRIKELDEEMDDKMDRVREQMAKKYLSFLREIIAPFNTRRHVIWVSCPMGSPAVRVGTGFASDYTRFSPLIDAIQAIDQMLAGCEWVHYLHGQRLNGAPGLV